MVPGMGTPDGLAVWRIVREGGSPPPVDTLTARSRPFSAAVSRAGTVTLIAVRTPDGVAGYVTAVNDRPGEQAVRNLAAAVGGRAEQVETLPELTSNAVGTLVARPREDAGRAGQYGGDPAEVAAAIGRAMHPGQWVAVSLRAPTRREASAAKRWFIHRLTQAGASTTHYATEMDSLVGTFRAGAVDRGEVDDLLAQVSAAIPGLDVETGVEVVSTWGPGGALGVAGVAAGAGAGYGLHTDAAGAVIAAVGVGLGVAVGTERLPSKARRLRAAVDRGQFPPPGKRRLPASKPRKETADTQGRHKNARPGSWPLARTSLLLGAAMPLGVVSPHSPDAASVSSTRMRSAPEAVLADIGPMIGYAGDGTQRVHLSSEDLWTGLAAIGIPGSGKTAMLNGLWAWCSAERTAPRPRHRTPGRSNTLIAFETKADGVAGWEEGLAATGDSRILVELADIMSPAIEMLHCGSTVPESVGLFVAAMIYAFADGGIQGRASEALTAMLSAAITADLASAWSAAGLPETPDPILATHVLLGGWGDDEAVSLARAVAEQAVEAPDNQALGAAFRGLAPYFGKTATPSSRRQLTESSRNKMALLVKAGSWWDPNRPRIRWRDALDEHWAVVVNTGASSPSSSSPGRLVDETLTTTITSMLTYLLRAEITRTCAGWQAAGRSVSIFADELSELAGASPEVVTWFRDKGRSYGVVPFFATQRPGQLDRDVRDSIAGFGNVAWFSQQSPTIARDAASQLSMRGVPFDETDLSNLERYHAILASTVNGQAQPGVPLRVAYWKDRRDQIAEAGYTVATPVTHTALSAGGSATASPGTDPYATSG